MNRLIPALAILGLSLAPLAAARASTDPTSPAAPAPQTAFDLTTARIVEMMDVAAAQQGASPASAVIMVRRGQAPLIWVQGRLAVDRAEAANADTPFYIASQTKAFVGLMAAALDARGVFSLDQSMADIWPALELPAGADARAITFRQLLSLQAPIENDALEFRTAYADRPAATDYGRLLAEGSRSRPQGFSYANLGYLVYGAALELKTGKDWRAWLDEIVLTPAGMSRSGPWPSSISPAELPSYHRWQGGDQWRIDPGKPDDLMHAAGGLNLTPNDMAKWLMLQLGEGGSAGDQAAIRATHAVMVRGAVRNDGIACQGYAIGWMSCRIGARDILLHGGAYTGVRSIMAVSPELGAGIAFMSNSDSLTGFLSQKTAEAFFKGLQDPASLPAADAFGSSYGERLSSGLPRRLARLADLRTDRRWRGWAWKPDATALRDYAGRFHHPAFGDAVIAMDGEALQIRLGLFRRPLSPAAPDLFALADGPQGALEPVTFERRDGRVAAVTWIGQRFVRAD